LKKTIIDLCNDLNRAIHEPLYHNFYNIPDELKYNQTFTSIDLIEDSQIAIEEFENAKTLGRQGRSTLLIYGLLQSFFLQQDGLYNLYKCVINDKIKLTEFFDLFSFNKEIRDVRNDIAGHPTNRNKTEFYFIAKGTTSKYRFTYAGYTPDFRKVEVDLKAFISNQFDFVNIVLLKIQNDIKNKIEMKKGEHKNIKLKEMIVCVNRNTQLIYRGIRDNERYLQGEWGISGVKDSIDKIRKELNTRYNENLPVGLSEVLRMIDYIMHRFDQWRTENTLLGNNDAEIFLDSLNKQLNELEEMLIENDEKFNN
jgi:hypothetical protein